MAVRPPPVTGLVVTPPVTTEGNYTVNWNASPMADSYTLSESVDAGGVPTPITLAALSKSFSSRGSGTYRYQVRACAAGTCGDYSPSVYVQVNRNHTPATPRPPICLVLPAAVAPSCRLRSMSPWRGMP